jgi:KUP system potassium uptake protein
VPPVLQWHVKINRALHERVFVLNVVTESIPWLGDRQRLMFEEVGPFFWRGSARFGFMERPDVPALIGAAHAGGCGLDLADVTYYVGHETVIARDDDQGLPRWMEALFASMLRNSAHVSDYYKLPRDTVVELGREVAI